MRVVSAVMLSFTLLMAFLWYKHWFVATRNTVVDRPDASADAGVSVAPFEESCQAVKLQYPPEQMPGKIVTFDGGSCDPCVRGCLARVQDEVQTHPDSGLPATVLLDWIQSCVTKCKGHGP